MPDPDTPTRDPDNARIVEALLAAYAEGAFPMAEPGGNVHWYDPDPRGIIPLDDGALRISRSLRQSLRSGRFTITTDRVFGEVIRACAAPRQDQPDGAWIDGRIIHAYEALHAAGHAHSIEAWIVPSTPSEGPPNEPDARARDTGTPQPSLALRARPDHGDLPPRSPPPTLVAGLYGVHLNALFAGESMFSRPDLGGTDASKVCLVHLWHHLRARGFTLLDTQFTTPHLESLGGVEISRDEYHIRLVKATQYTTDWAPFAPNPLRL